MAGKNGAQSLVEQAKGGDRGGFDQLVRDYHPRLECLVQTKLGAHLRGCIPAEDVLQETLLRAFRSLKSFSLTPEERPD